MIPPVESHAGSRLSNKIFIDSNINESSITCNFIVNGSVENRVAEITAIIEKMNPQEVEVNIVGIGAGIFESIRNRYENTACRIKSFYPTSRY